MNKLSAFIIFAFAAVNIFAAENKASPDAAEARMLKILKKGIEYNSKNQLPVQVPEKYYSKLNLTTPLCEDPKLNAKIKSCAYYKCFKKRNVGENIMYSEVIVHGFNAQKNCAISYKDLRYFIPNSDLNDFVPQFDQSSNLHNEALSVFHSSSGKNNPVSVVFPITVQDTICKVRATYQIDLDTKSAVVSKPQPNRKIKGIEKINNNNSVKTYYEFKNVVYSPEHKAFNFIPKLISYELIPESAAKCKNSKASVLVFELEKKGFIQDSTVK